MSEQVDYAEFRRFSMTDMRGHELRKRTASFQRFEAARIEGFGQFLVPALCAEFNVAEADLFSRRQTRPISRPRHIMVWLLRNHPEARFSYPIIAKYIDRDHTTVMVGEESAKHRIRRNDQNERFKAQNICNRLANNGFMDWTVTA